MCLAQEAIYAIPRRENLFSPKTMKAIRLEDRNLILRDDSPIPIAKKRHCLVQIRSAALNRRDQWICEGAYPRIQNATLGSDGSGIVVEGDVFLGEEVVICPSLHWGNTEAFQSEAYSILGMPTDGTFAEYCLVPTENVVPKPKHLSHEQASALPLAGLTAWRALFTQGRLQKGEKLLITGIGGGVSTLALQLAVAYGAHVWVTSSSEQKIQKAISLGAQGGVHYTNAGWEKELAPNFDVILDGAGGPGLGALVRKVAMGGRIVFYGGTSGAWPSILPQHLFFKQAHIIGSTMGSEADFVRLIEFVSQHTLVPVIEEVFPLQDYVRAFAAQLDASKMGKVVLSIS